jgi:adenylylsulfate kinase-like enzyme
VQQHRDVPLLLIAGAPAAGKSSVAWEIFFTLIRSGVPVATLDLDVVGYGPPSAFRSFEMKVRNLGSIWSNYQAAGARCFVVSGLQAAADEIEACARAVPGSVSTVFVLTVTEAEQRARIFRRARQEYGSNTGGGSSNQTPEALERFAADATLELARSEPIPGALVLDTVGVGVPELAHRVLSATDWPDLTRLDESE